MTHALERSAKTARASTASRSLAVMLTCLLAVLSVSIARAASDDDRPNFLLITSEDMSPDLGCYGDPSAITPNLDQLARNGNAYSSAYATGPICSPARTAFLFGMHQGSLGAGNHRSRANTPPELLGFASYLREAGYFCTNGPKVDYNSATAWDIERATYDRGTDWRHPDRAGRPFLSIINIAVSHQSYTSVLPFEQYRTQVRNQLPPEWIHDPKTVQVPPYMPDTPAVRKELARYADCVSLMDKRAGDILDRLAADGLDDSTIVIYFSDHGAGHPRHKSTPYVTGLQVPFIVYCPPKFQHLLRAPAGSMCDDLVTFIDIGPTLLDLAGAEIPEYMQGSVFLGENAAPLQLAFGALDRRAESLHLARTVTDGRYFYIRNYLPHIPFGQPKGYGYPSAIYQELARLDQQNALSSPEVDYLRPQPNELLFDLRADPHQINNIASDPSHAETLRRLRAANRAHLRSIRDINFLPEEELARRAGPQPWIDVVDDDTLAAILFAAEEVGDKNIPLTSYATTLSHREPAVRWWGVIALRQRHTAPSDSLLVSALNDTAAVVRVEAASAAAARGIATKNALSVLKQAIEGNDPRIAHRAARAFQLLDIRDEQIENAINAAATGHATEWLQEVARAIDRTRLDIKTR